MRLSRLSFVAQSTISGIRKYAGLVPSSILSADRDTPDSFETTYAVATDDVMLMSSGGPGVTSTIVGKLDKSMTRVGMVKHTGKDIDDVTDTVCIGLALGNGMEMALIGRPRRFVALRRSCCQLRLSIEVVQHQSKCITYWFFTNSMIYVKSKPVMLQEDLRIHSQSR